MVLTKLKEWIMTQKFDHQDQDMNNNSSIQKTFPAFYGQFYMSQGFRKEKEVSNDCGPTSVAMMINIILYHENVRNLNLRKENIIHQSKLHFWDRLPKNFPSVGGATAPWGMVTAFNQWMQRLGLPWQAARVSNATRQTILEAIISGKYVSALKVWKNGGAHWVNIVDFSAEDDTLYTLDPNPYLVHLPQNRRIQKETWEKFSSDWERRKAWSYLLGLHRELIVYTRDL